MNFDALHEFRAAGADFKFVIDGQEDWFEMQQLVEEVSIPKRVVWVMPQVTKRSEYVAKYKKLIPLAIEHGYNVSQRLQILFWGSRRGV
jgi:hypothetical protein